MRVCVICGNEIFCTRGIRSTRFQPHNRYISWSNTQTQRFSMDYTKSPRRLYRATAKLSDQWQNTISYSVETHFLFVLQVTKEQVKTPLRLCMLCTFGSYFYRQGQRDHCIVSKDTEVEKILGFIYKISWTSKYHKLNLCAIFWSSYHNEINKNWQT